MKKRIKLFWIIPIIFSAGIFGFYTSSFSFFKFKNEIDLVSLFSLIITSTFATYIALNLQNKLDANKFEKELFFKLIEPISKRIKFIGKNIEKNQLKFPDATSSFKLISSYLSDVESTNEFCEVIEISDLETLRQKYIELKNLITNDIPTVDNYLVFEDNQKRYLNSKIEQFNRNLLKLIISINRTL